MNSKESKESNESKTIINKPDYKMTKLNKNSYLFEYEIINNGIFLDRIINLDFIKLINEINKRDVFEDFYLEEHDANCATVYILFKHFFNDFGMSQKYALLYVNIEKTENHIIFNTIPSKNPSINNKLISEPGAEPIPISNITAICDFISPHHVKIKTTTTFNRSINYSEFIEKLSTTIISKVFLRTKQFIEKMRINS
jgi:hypothetical protein